MRGSKAVSSPPHRCRIHNVHAGSTGESSFTTSTRALPRRALPPLARRHGRVDRRPLTRGTPVSNPEPRAGDPARGTRISARWFALGSEAVTGVHTRRPHSATTWAGVSLDRPLTAVDVSKRATGPGSPGTPPHPQPP